MCTCTRRYNACAWQQSPLTFLRRHLDIHPVYQPTTSSATPLPHFSPPADSAHRPFRPRQQISYFRIIVFPFRTIKRESVGLGPMAIIYRTPIKFLSEEDGKRNGKRKGKGESVGFGRGREGGRGS